MVARLWNSLSSDITITIKNFYILLFYLLTAIILNWWHLLGHCKTEKAEVNGPLAWSIGNNESNGSSYVLMKHVLLFLLCIKMNCWSSCWVLWCFVVFFPSSPLWKFISATVNYGFNRCTNANRFFSTDHQRFHWSNLSPIENKMHTKCRHLTLQIVAFVCVLRC